MAIDPSAVYPGQIDTSDPTGYPQGKAQDETALGARNGTPLEKNWLTDLFGLEQSLLAEAGLTPSGTPDKVGGSQYLDAIKKISIAQAAPYNAHSALQSWRKSDALPGVLGGGSKTPVLVGLRPDHGFGAAQANRVLIVLADRAAGTGTTLVRSGDGSAVDAGSITSSYQGLDGAFPGVPGVVVGFRNNNADFIYSVNHGLTWTLNSSLTDPTYGATCALLGIGSCYLFAGSSGAISRMTTIGGTHTVTTLPGVGTGLAQNVEFADDGVGTIVCCGKRNGNSFSTLWRSTDGGVTFALSIDLSAEGNIAWNSSQALFVASDANGGIWTSPTGVTWSFFSSAFAFSQGLQVGRASFACAGQAIVRRWKSSLSGGAFIQDGIGYSLDLGRTWNFVSMGDATGVTGNNILQLHGFNGRIYVLSYFFIWASGRIAQAAAEL